MKKMLYWMSLNLVAFCAVLISCNNEPAFGEHNENQKEKLELLQIAKSMVESQDGTVPLPVNCGGEAQSRSAMSLITSGTPLWDYVKYYNIDGMHVIMVELQTAERVFSRVTSTTDGVTTTQENETFSRLVIRKKADKLYAQVLTYMPDNEYATANQAKLDTIGYYPKYVDFTGITLTSNLDGSVFRGVRYENGRVAGIITKPEHSECDHDHGTCSHSQDAEHTRPININLFTQSTQEPLSRASVTCGYCRTNIDDHGKCMCLLPGTGKMCDRCHTRSKEGDYCLRCGFLEDYYCSKCNNRKYKCTCSDDNKSCPICGVDYKESDYANGHECKPNVCSKCGYEKCVCPTPEQIPTPEPGTDTDTVGTCDICKQESCICCKKCNSYPCICACENCGEVLENCICETNTDPIDYDLHDNDMLVGIIDECVEPNTCCAMAVLEMAYRIYDGIGMNQQTFAQYYTQFNYMSPNEDETILDYNDNFMTHFFETSSFSTMTAEINSNNVIVVRKNQHYVLVFGLQYDGDVIYADPHEGGIYAVSENYFNGCDAFVIEGINQSRMRTLAQ